MKKATAVVLAVLAGVSGMAVGADVSVSLDLASAYVFRGSTLNDGFVVQPGLEVSGLPVTIGVWGNLDIDDYDDALDSGEFSEIDIYASYGLPLDIESVGFSVGCCEYTYPSGGGEADREVSLSAELDMLLSPSLDIHYGIDGAIDRTLYAELGIGHEIGLSEKVTLAVSAALGYLDPDEGESGFSHADLSLGIGCGLLSVGVTYIAQIDDDVLPDVEDGGSYDTEFVATAGIATDF